MTNSDGERSPSVLLTIDDESHIATLTLNRPEALNAISRQLAAEFPRTHTGWTGGASEGHGGLLSPATGR